MIPSSAATCAADGEPLLHQQQPAWRALLAGLSGKAIAAMLDTGKAVFKFVCAAPADVDEVIAVTKRLGIPPSLTWIMPEGTKPAILNDRLHDIADQAIAAGFNLAKLRKKIRKRIDEGRHPKPLVLVRTPGADKDVIADGHHHFVATEQEGEPTFWAYVGNVKKKTGPRDTMHTQQEGSRLGRCGGRAGDGVEGVGLASSQVHVIHTGPGSVLSASDCESAAERGGRPGGYGPQREPPVPRGNESAWAALAAAQLGGFVSLERLLNADRLVVSVHGYPGGRDTA